MIWTSFVHIARCNEFFPKKKTRSSCSFCKRIPFSISLCGFSTHDPQPIMLLMSLSTSVMPPMPKVSTSTFATFGERNAGSVGPR